MTSSTFTRRAFLGAAAAALAAPLAGCMGGFMEKVTERDIEVARQLGAPDDIIASMERGRWPSSPARLKVHNAEACMEYVLERYGLQTSAIRATGGAKWMTNFDEVTLRIESGEYAGEEVHLRYDSGMRDGKQAKDPEIREDCYYVVNHEEWERIASEAALPVLADLPEGGWFVNIRMSNQLYSQHQIEKPILEGGGNGDVFIYISLETCELIADSMTEMLTEAKTSLDSTGLRGGCAVFGYEGPETDRAFVSGEIPPLSERTWYESLPFGN